MPSRKKPSTFPLADITPEQRVELDRVEREAFLRYEGPLDELEKALGMLRLGHHMGWKPLVVAHSKRTIAKYEEVLGIKLSEIFGPEGPSARRSVGYRIALQLKNFWKAVSGETAVPDRQLVTRDAPKGT